MFFATGAPLLSAVAIGWLFISGCPPLAVLKPLQVKPEAVTPVRPTSVLRSYLKIVKQRKLSKCIVASNLVPFVFVTPAGPNLSDPQIAN